MITQHSVILALIVMILLHALNVTVIRRRFHLRITFIILEILAIGITWTCLTLPTHYIPFYNLLEQPTYSLVLYLLIAISSISYILKKYCNLPSDKYDDDDLGIFFIHLLIPMAICAILMTVTQHFNLNYTETLDTQTTTSVLYKTELDSHVTLTYHEKSISKDKDTFEVSSINTLSELQKLEKDYQTSRPRITLTAQGATSDIKPQSPVKIQSHTNSNQAKALELTLPDQVDIEITQINLSKITYTQRHWIDVLLHTNNTITSEPEYVLDIHYKITNLEQLQNTKEVQHKLDKLLQNVQ